MKDIEKLFYGQNSSNSTSVIFDESFGGNVNQPFCADIDADVTFMDEKIFQKIENKENNFIIQNFWKTIIYEKAAKNENGYRAKIKCDESIILDMELHIRHRTSLMLRDIAWYITEKAVTEPLLGRPVMEALGLSTECILAAAAHRYNGSLDLSHLCTNHEGVVSHVCMTAYTAQTVLLMMINPRRKSNGSTLAKIKTRIGKLFWKMLKKCFR